MADAVYGSVLICWQWPVYFAGYDWGWQQYFVCGFNCIYCEFATSSLCFDFKPAFISGVEAVQGFLCPGDSG